MNLYSRRKFLASAAVVLVCAAALAGATAQRRKAHKLRATAILEITTDSAGIVSTRVFPVTVLDEGRFNDASIYKAITTSNGPGERNRLRRADVWYARRLRHHLERHQQPWLDGAGQVAARGLNAKTTGRRRPWSRVTTVRLFVTAIAPRQLAAHRLAHAFQHRHKRLQTVAPAAPSEDADRPTLKRRDPQKQEPPEPAAVQANPGGRRCPCNQAPRLYARHQSACGRV